jgi:hypothetical protein
LPPLLNTKNVYIPSEAVTITQFAQHLLENAIGKIANIIQNFQITKMDTLCIKWKKCVYKELEKNT